MKLIFTSYVKVSDYSHPENWLKRIEAYTGILEALSVNNEVISFERINYRGECKKNGVFYKFITATKSSLYFPIRIHTTIRKLRPDVVFVNGLIFPLQIIQLKIFLKRKTKLILIHRSERPHKGIRRYLQRIADNFVDAYLFTSNEFGIAWKKTSNISAQSDVFEVMHASSIFTVANDVEVNQNFPETIRKPVFLWVGRLNANKDPVTVISAFKKFKHHEPNARLYMIYQTDELLEEVVQCAGDDKSIHLVGKVEHSELQSWYNGADFIISSSHYEGGGVAVCEAMSCGCIPILTNIISFRKITGPGNCGQLFEAGNENDLFRCLLTTKEMDLKKERKKTIEQFNRELSFSAIAGKIEKVIESLNKN